MVFPLANHTWWTDCLPKPRCLLVLSMECISSVFANSTVLYGTMYVVGHT